MDHSLEERSENSLVLTGKKDMFGGVTIEMNQQTCTSDSDFDKMLSASLIHWRGVGIRGVWIKIPIAQSSFIPVAVKHGLVFHHAQSDFVMMNHWLPTDEPNTLPSMATSYIGELICGSPLYSGEIAKLGIGAGGFVINDKNELLVICERFRTKRHWKLPGGQVDVGEDIPIAAEREVLEETGIRAEFVSLLCFRHLHKFRFGCDDIYFVCLMRPLTHEIKADTREIADARWMDLEEYIKSPLVNENNKVIARAYKETFGDKKVGIVPTSVMQYNRTEANVYTLKFLSDVA